MKQQVSNQMGDDHIVQQNIADSISEIGAIAATQFFYEEGVEPFAIILEVSQ